MSSLDDMETASFGATNLSMLLANNIACDAKVLWVVDSLLSRLGDSSVKIKGPDNPTCYQLSVLFRLTLEQQEGKRKYKSDGAVMVGEFVCMYVCSCTVSQ